MPNFILSPAEDQRLHGLVIEVAAKEEKRCPIFAEMIFRTYLAARTDRRLAEDLYKMLEEHKEANAHVWGRAN